MDVSIPPAAFPRQGFAICRASVVKTSISPAATLTLPGVGSTRHPACPGLPGRCRWTQWLSGVSLLPDVQPLGHPNHCPIEQAAPAVSCHTSVRGSCRARSVTPESAPSPRPVSVCLSVCAPACPLRCHPVLLMTPWTQGTDPRTRACTQTRTYTYVYTDTHTQTRRSLTRSCAPRCVSPLRPRLLSPPTRALLVRARLGAGGAHGRPLLASPSRPGLRHRLPLLPVEKG